MNTVKYYKQEMNKGLSFYYLKVINNSKVISVWDSEFAQINYNSFPLSTLNECTEIESSEFNDVFNRVHQKLKDLLLDIDCAELTPQIANLVRNYDHNYMYIESMSQLKMVEQNNAKIKEKLKELGVKSFEGVVL